jgi:pilus assembly protein CpaF
VHGAARLVRARARARPRSADDSADGAYDPGGARGIDADPYDGARDRDGGIRDGVFNAHGAYGTGSNADVALHTADSALARAPGIPVDGGYDDSTYSSPYDSDPPTDATTDQPAEMSRWLDFGPLAPYLADDAVTDVFVNGTSGLWVDNGQQLVRQDSWQADERSLRELAVRLISLGGRHIDEATPCVDVRLRDGMRVHAVLPPVSTSGTLLSIRVPRRARFRLDELAQAGTLSPSQVVRLRYLITSRSNLLVTGASGSGKTTLLSAILAEASPHERIVTIEDVAELRVEHPHIVALEARQPNLEGAGEIGMTRLLREALRMRPDRLVVGECRGPEIRELLGALNTGHDGGAGTLHANSLRDVPARIEALGALAGMSQEAVARQTVSAIGHVLHLEREGGVRSLAQIGRFRIDEHGHLAMDDEALE